MIKVYENQRPPCLDLYRQQAFGIKSEVLAHRGSVFAQLVGLYNIGGLGYTRRT